MLLTAKQAQRGIRYDVDNKHFVSKGSKYLLMGNHTITRPSTNDEDSFMSDAGTSESDVEMTLYTPSECSTTSDLEPAQFTPQALSIASTDDQEASMVRIRASTPTEVQVVSPRAGPSTPKAGEIGEEVEDRPMMDISPERGQRLLDASDVPRTDLGSLLGKKSEQVHASDDEEIA